MAAREGAALLAGLQAHHPPPALHPTSRTSFTSCAAVLPSLGSLANAFSAAATSCAWSTAPAALITMRGAV